MHELLNKLKKLEETQLVDMLGLTSEQIVEAFLEVIEDRFDYLYEQVGEEEQGE